MKQTKDDIDFYKNLPPGYKLIPVEDLNKEHRKYVAYMIGYIISLLLLLCVLTLAIWKVVELIMGMF